VNRDRDTNGILQQLATWKASADSLHILWCEPELPPFTTELERSGISISLVDDARNPAGREVPNVHGDCPSERSDFVLHALAEVHHYLHFDLIVFPALAGLGFRTIQARQGGLAFQGVTLAVYLDTCSALLRDEQERWPEDLDELEVDFLERRSFEGADIRLFSQSEILEYVRAIGWEVGASTNRDAGPAPGDDEPLVTVCVPHFNLGAHLPRTLEALAEQTYPHLEVLVIDDGSTDPASRAVFQVMRVCYPQFRFLTQENAGIGATRNRGLAEAQGSYFIPVDADNVPRRDMVERLVAGIRERPELGALTCYFLAFEEDADLDRGKYRYAYRPTGGPHVLASMRNVYGDATAIYRTEAFRAVGGYETDRGTSFEDWEAFVKLVQAGYAIDVLPMHLFCYRHREAGFSRVTRSFANHERVLRQFRAMDHLPAVERMALWNALMGFHRKADHLTARERSLRYRLADRVHAACRRVPFVTRTLRWLLGARTPHPQERNPSC
jgi:glycosyltransferase involved in cell wall biosynthesis